LGARRGGRRAGHPEPGQRHGPARRAQRQAPDRARPGADPAGVVRPGLYPAADPMTALVEMIAMQKRFGAVRAVDDVSCELQAGEVVGVLGHNGAGKTTLMKMLAGVYPEYGGTIKVRGAEVKLASPRDAQRAGIETIYQHLALADNLDA